MLFKKLIRTMGRYKAQFISMIIMTALGIGVFLGFNIEWYTIETDVNKFLADTGFADYRIVSADGFSEEDEKKIAEIDGVEKTSRYISVNTTVKGTSKVLTLTVTEDPDVSGVYPVSGDEYDETSEDGLWISDRYAEANDLKPGDSVSLEYSGLSIEGTVKGLVKSGEYLICVTDETQLMPDYTTYGFAYMSPAMLKKVMGQEFYTQINVISGLDKTDFTKAADDALHTTSLIITKDDTISYSEAMGESEEGKTMCSILPVIFLAIAVLTMVTTMNRLAAAEKTQIGTLKSLGFKDRRILRHYTSYGIFIGIVGTIPGLLLGWWLGWFIMNPGGPMGTYLDMPDWSLHTPVYVWFVIAAIVLLMVLITYLSVKNMLRGNAAESLKPYTPKKVRKLFLERFPFWDRMSFGTKWNLRDTFRHKARSLMTLIGVMGCVVIIIATFGINDMLNKFLDENYNEAINYNNKVFLDTAAVTEDDVDELAEKYEADRSAQMSILINDEETASLEIYDIDHDLVRFLDTGSGCIDLTDDGAYVCGRIRDMFGLSEGDTFYFSPYGSDEKYTVKVAGFYRSTVEGIIMTDKYAEETGIEALPGILYTASEDVESESRILSVQSKTNIMESFDTFVDLLMLMIFLMTVAAVLLGIIVLYNLGVMSYIERYREMATLKVLGFKDRKIGALLTGQNMWLTAAGIVVGIPLGIAILKYLMDALAGEYELKLYISPLTYAITIALTLGMSLLVSLMISRKNKKIDMVEALKSE